MIFVDTNALLFSNIELFFASITRIIWLVRVSAVRAAFIMKKNKLITLLWRFALVMVALSFSSLFYTEKKINTLSVFFNEKKPTSW
jgi:hypothetical protein